MCFLANRETLSLTASAVSAIGGALSAYFAWKAIRSAKEIRETDYVRQVVENNFIYSNYRGMQAVYRELVQDGYKDKLIRRVAKQFCLRLGGTPDLKKECVEGILKAFDLALSEEKLKDKKV